MKIYSDKISLSKNDRGILDFDTIKGCSEGMKIHSNGCYGDCYAAKLAKAFGYDFSVSVNRHFKSERHKQQIRNKILKEKINFIRIGCSGDPSIDWSHTINIIKELYKGHQLKTFPEIEKEIVIITKHWHTLTEIQMNDILKYPICINTSVSAIDDNIMLEKCIIQYEILKKYCKSVLRVVTFDFNLDNIEGQNYNKIQKYLLSNENVIDTVFRPSKNNELVLKNIINVKKGNFMGKQTLMSKYNKKTYVGKCDGCLEMCGTKII